MAIATTQWKMKCSPSDKQIIAAVAKHYKRPQAVVMRLLAHEAYKVILTKAAGKPA